jgi:uncharacterized protein (DUF2062 family)
MNPDVSSVKVQTRNPVLQSLALAVLGVALVAAMIMGALVFAVLLGVFIVGYLVSLVYAWWRLFRIRRRAASVDREAPPPAAAEYIEGEFEAVEATADTAQRGSGGPA